MSRGLSIWIAVFSCLVAAGWNTRFFDVDMTFICASELAKDDRNAADVLLLGNSRLGAAVDALYLQRLLRDRLGEPGLVVEKLALLGSHATQFHVILREYVQRRGAPRLAVIAVPYGTTVDSIFSGRPLYMERTVLFSSMHNVIAVQSAFLQNDPELLLRRVSEAEWQAVPELFIFRATESVYAILRAVPRHMNGASLTCPAERRTRLAARRWPHGDLEDGVDLGALKGQITMGPVSAGIARRISNQVLEFDPKDPRRFFEVEQLRQMSSYLRRHGTRVVLTEMPLYMHAGLGAARVAAFEQQVPGVRFLDSYRAQEAVPEEVRPDLFRDAMHMNFGGAYLETGFLGRELPRYID